MTFPPPSLTVVVPTHYSRYLAVSDVQVVQALLGGLLVLLEGQVVRPELGLLFVLPMAG